MDKEGVKYIYRMSLSIYLDLLYFSQQCFMVFSVQVLYFFLKSLYGVVNGIILIVFSSSLLLVYRNTIYICMLIFFFF